MSALRIDDQFLNNVKVAKLEEHKNWSDCMSVWLVIGCSSAAMASDGQISHAKLSRITPLSKKRLGNALRVLLEVGLLEKTDTGVQLHDFLDWNESQEEQKQRKKLHKIRQKRYRNEIQKTRHADIESLEKSTTYTKSDASHDASRDWIPSPLPDPDQEERRDSAPQKVDNVIQTPEQLEAWMWNKAGLSGCLHREGRSGLPYREAELESALKTARAKKGRDINQGYIFGIVRGDRSEAAQAANVTDINQARSARLPRKRSSFQDSRQEALQRALEHVTSGAADEAVRRHEAINAAIAGAYYA